MINYSQETTLIIGAGSSCGKYAVQICALAGFGTIIATASLGKNESALRSYGATHVIDRHTADTSGLDADKVNCWVLDQYRDGKTPARRGSGMFICNVM